MGAESLPPSSWTTPNGNQRKITGLTQLQSNAVGMCSTPNGNQWKGTRGYREALSTTSAQRLAASMVERYKHS